MRASQRYELISKWEEVARIATGSATGLLSSSENGTVIVVHEAANIRDTQGGHEYHWGAHKISAKFGLSDKTYKGSSVRPKLSGRSKTFYGETAWMDAERLYDDLVSDIRFGR